MGLSVPGQTEEWGAGASAKWDYGGGARARVDKRGQERSAGVYREHQMDHNGNPTPPTSPTPKCALGVLTASGRRSSKSWPATVLPCPPFCRRRRPRARVARRPRDPRTPCATLLNVRSVLRFRPRARQKPTSGRECAPTKSLSHTLRLVRHTFRAGAARVAACICRRRAAARMRLARCSRSRATRSAS